IERVLRSGTRQSASRRSRLGTEGLVVGQIALALLVLSAAGLVARSLTKLERADLSFQPSHLLIGDLALRYDQFDSPAKQQALLERLLPQVRAIPGVQAVSPVVAAPFSGPGGWDGKFAAEGQSPERAAANPMLNMEVVTPDYFATLGIPARRVRGQRGRARCRGAVRRHGDHGAPTHARAGRADGAWSHRSRSAAHGDGARPRGRERGIGAGATRRATGEPSPGVAALRRVPHGPGDAHDGHRVPYRYRGARKPH